MQEGGRGKGIEGNHHRMSEERKEPMGETEGKQEAKGKTPGNGPYKQESR